MLRRAALALVVSLAVTAALAGCDALGGEVPEGTQAIVGDRTFGPQDIAAVQAQLGAYAQLRFRADEGKHALLMALVDAELMAQAAIDAGLADDPRVRFAELEEIAAVERSSQLERLVPRAEVEADTAALRAHYDAHAAAFMVPEHRSAEGVTFDTWIGAESALAKVQRGESTLESLGEIVHTQPQARDDDEFQGFHPVLFAADLDEGELLPVPVVIGPRLLVARVRAVQPAHLQPFEDPAVQEALVEAVRAPRVEAARRARLDELAGEFPEG
jgi:predicted transcriptional regulator